MTEIRKRILGGVYKREANDIEKRVAFLEEELGRLELSKKTIDEYNMLQEKRVFNLKLNGSYGAIAFLSVFLQQAIPASELYCFGLLSILDNRIADLEHLHFPNMPRKFKLVKKQVEMMVINDSPFKDVVREKYNELTASIDVTNKEKTSLKKLLLNLKYQVFYTKAFYDNGAFHRVLTDEIIQEDLPEFVAFYDREVSFEPFPITPNSKIRTLKKPITIKQ